MMKGSKAVREEHKKAQEQILVLSQRGEAAGANGPLPADINQYLQLNTIKETLEWVLSSLIETTTKPTDPNHINELLSHRFYALGPVDATLTWPRR
jgi:hypothetical protein